ncbi:MAG: DUF1194 domain-containing protein [Marinibacterium sp.]
MIRAVWLAAVLALMAAASATAACRQALVLALDVSGSVNAREYRLQLDGLAAALDDPRVRAAILAMPQAPVDLTIFEWSAQDYHRRLLPWTTLSDAAALDSVIVRLRATRRQAAPPGTALGTAILTGTALAGERPGCWKQTVDISGDGKHNNGPHPRSFNPVAQRVTVNALVIGVGAPRIGDRRQEEIADLAAYFRAYVIRGPGAFVETALGFENFEAAMVRKLLRELEGLTLSQWTPALTRRP